MTAALGHLHRKARRLAEGQLADDEEIVTVFPGRVILYKEHEPYKYATETFTK